MEIVYVFNYALNLPWSITGPSSTESDKSHSMPLKSNNKTQEVSTSMDTLTASKQVVTSMSQPTHQFI